MGCCESCLGTEENEPNERTSLLRNADTGNVAPINSTDPVRAPVTLIDSPPGGSLSRSKQDEQSILSGIIQQYNNDVIDVTSLDSKIDAVEYMNRVQAYNRKIATLAGAQLQKQQSLHSVCNNPADVLTGPPIGIDDVFLITQCSNDLCNAVDDIKVEKNKELVLSLARR